MRRRLPSTLPPPGSRPFPDAPGTDRLLAERPDREAHLDFAATLFADAQVAATLWPEHLGGPRTQAQTRSVFERYNIVSDGDLGSAAQRIDDASDSANRSANLFRANQGGSGGTGKRNP